ncbi:sugar-binding transcriptional regulator [Alkalihalobacillus pseudalcaliphilus]|uniref:sugar-binding transcriptional regulator n=1 Tax=Alkalihalobacillus pseudalcaliphilus TaxID=79884 RepID=UPI00064DF2A9|nr:sugar-binding domain-containing protein [Alkalihalobacillus pseudalcaliphilus]KMK77488.1 central glycolytic genes regulator [Alkalihalobacillus pseudalcaliphilus]
MKSLITLQKQLVPDLLDTMVKRYRILQNIRLMQPIGRRTLSTNVQLSERVLRSEVTFLKEQRIVDFTTAGMSLTAQGEVLFTELEEMMKELQGLSSLEKELQDKLGVSKVIIVSGDSDENDWVKHELGQAAALELNAHLKPKDVVAVMGGTTLAAVARMMPADSKNRDVVFVPARGGLGEKVENQANTISAEFATRAHAQYRLLHVPDQLSEEAYSSLIIEPSVQEILKIIKSASVVIHGIGDAEMMASRRNSQVPFLEKLIEHHAVGEAFGYYFDENGKSIHKQRTIGLQLDELDQDKYVISVAGGHSKAKAIAAYVKNRPTDVLVTDEGAANSLLVL